ncbi:MAG: hypothetical protein COB42_05620 [Sulfurimonas sp.]|nr:MAG: hypothetical protein COB42_05620 [Sulfurimonas sp.]
MFETLENGTPPTRGSKYSACVDLYASEDVVISAGGTKVIGLGVCIDENVLKTILKAHGEHFFSSHIEEFKNSHYLQLMLIDSLGEKGLIVPSGIKIIDLDYKDEIKMIVHNPMDITSVHSLNENSYPNFIEIKKGDRVGQITLLEHKSYLFGIDTEDERTGGLGSTDS